MGYVDKTTSLVVSDEDTVFRDHMKDWFYSFMSEITTKEMEVDSLIKMKRYMHDVRAQGKVNQGLINFTDIFRIKSF